MEQNKTIEEITRILKYEKKFFIVSHVDPDGDAIGSLLALSLGLLRAGKDVWPFIHKPLQLPYLMLDTDKILRCDLPERLDEYICVALDCANGRRLGKVYNHLHSFKRVINIDHHMTNSLFGDVNWVDPKASCVGEMLFWILKSLEIPFDKDVFGNLYYAIQTDTGGFRFDNTSSRALAVAHFLVEKGVVPWEVFSKVANTKKIESLRLLCEGIKHLEFYKNGALCILVLKSEDFERSNATLEDADDFVELLRGLYGVELIVLAKETSYKRFKFSLRSNGGQDVALIALEFGGGGHRAAAGFELEGDWENIKAKVLNRLLHGMEISA